MADQTPSRRRTAVLAVAAAGLAAVVGAGWFLLTDRQAEGPSVMAAATVSTVTGDTLAVQPPAETTAPITAAPVPTTTTAAPAVTTTLAPAVTTTTAAPAVTTTLAPAATTTTAALAAASALAPAEELEEAAVPVTTATPAVAATTIAVTSTSVVGLVEFETVVPVATTAAPAADDASATAPPAGGEDVVVAGGRVFVRPSADTVDCRGNFRRGYRVRDACVMEAVTRTWTLAWAGAREDLLSVVWYGHLLEDTLAQRMEWEKSDAFRDRVEEKDYPPAVAAYGEARVNDSLRDGAVVEVHGGHWHAPDKIGVRMRLLFDGEVVMPWIAGGTYYLDGKWQIPYRVGCQMMGVGPDLNGISCPPDPRPDWKPDVVNFLSMYSPVDDRENRT